MLKLIVLLIPGFILSCANMPPIPSSVQINQKYAVSTTTTKNWGVLQNHKATPVVLGKNLIVANGYDGIGLYKQSTGREIWKKIIKNGVEATPIIENNKIYFGGNDGVFYCLDAETGKIVWTFPIKFEGLGKAVIDGNFVYFSTGNHNLYSLYKDSGKLKWIYTRKVNSKISVRGQGDIIVSGESLYTGFSDGYMVSFNKVNGQINWEKKLNNNRRFNDVDSSPILVGETLFVSGFDSMLNALDKKSGNIVWQAPYGSHVGVIHNQNVLYSSTSKGELVAVNARNGKLIWKLKLKKGIATQPLYYKGYLLVGEASGDFKVISSVNGEEISNYQVGRGIRANIAQKTDSNQFFALTRSGNLFSFDVASINGSEVWPWDEQ